MASAIDPTVFPDNAAVDKSNLRQQLQIAKDEITALQVATGTGGGATALAQLQDTVTSLLQRVTALESA